MNAKLLNNKALNEFENLKKHGHFETLIIVEQQMKENKDPFDVGFYQAKQDELNYIYGEIENAHSELNADLEKYIVEREREIAIELTKNKEFKSIGETIKLTSTLLAGILKNIVKGEVGDMYSIVLQLESKKWRIMNSIQSARNHTYGKKGDIS